MSSRRAGRFLIAAIGDCRHAFSARRGELIEARVCPDQRVDTTAELRSFLDSFEVLTPIEWHRRAGS